MANAKPPEVARLDFFFSPPSKKRVGLKEGIFESKMSKFEGANLKVGQLLYGSL